VKRKTAFLILLISLWITAVGCPQLDPLEGTGAASQELLIMQVESGKPDRRITVLNLDPDETIEVSIRHPVTDADLFASTKSSSGTISVSNAGISYFVRGDVPGGMGTVTFSSQDRTGELRVFVRNWARDQVHRTAIYSDQENYPYSETPYDPSFYNGTPPYTANRWAAYRLIVDQGFDYEAPDGLSHRTNGVHADEVREADYRHKHNVPHIVPVNDKDYLQAGNFRLYKDVFKFILHYEFDGDMVGGFADRQRLELKTMNTTEEQKPGSTHRYSTGGGDTFTHRWKFRLPEKFYVSTEYTHIHQIKPEGGDAGNPTFTLTARRLRTGREVLQLIYRGPIRDNGDPSVNWYPCQVDLEPFKGEWIQAIETVTYDYPGAYRIRLVRLRDMKILMEYIYSPELYQEPDPFVMYRKGNSYIRPKFGIYRRIMHVSPFGLPDEEDPVTAFLAETKAETLDYRGNPVQSQEVVVLYADIEMDKLKR